MPHTLIALSIVLLPVCAAALALFLRDFKNQKFVRALLFKGISSLCFVTLGAINCFANGASTVKLLIFIGLCFGLVGDEVIALCQVSPKHDTLSFIGGGLFFLVGHILYIPALVMLGEISWTAVIIAFGLMVSLSLFYESHRGFLAGKTQIPLSLYLGIVTFMGTIAIGVFFKRFTLGAGLFAIGGILFALSDNILFAYKFGNKPKIIQNIALHVAYYIAQLLIACSIACL